MHSHDNMNDDTSPLTQPLNQMKMRSSLSLSIHPKLLSGKHRKRCLETANVRTRHLTGCEYNIISKT